MATTELDIVNAALSLVGERALSSLGEQRQAAEVARVAYPQVRDALLAQHRWAFAVRTARLSRFSEPPAFGFKYRYALPADCLRVISIYDPADPTSQDTYASGLRYQVVGREVHTDEETVDLFYVARVEDVGAFPPVFVEALKWHLAHHFALTLADASASMAQHLADQAARSLFGAQSVNAIENPQRATAVTNSWVDAREWY